MDTEERSYFIRGWGIFLLSVAGVLWLAFAWRLLLPYHVDDMARQCDAPVFPSDGYVPDHVLEACADGRRLETTMLLLGIAVPLSALGTILFSTFHIRLLLSRATKGEEQAAEQEDQDAGD